MEKETFAYIRVAAFILIIFVFCYFLAEASRAPSADKQPDPPASETVQEHHEPVAEIKTLESIQVIPAETPTAPATLSSENPQQENHVEQEPAEEPETAPAPEPAPQEPKARYSLTDEERAIVEAVVAAEARGEDFDGQVLVAQCILNTAEARGMRPDEVVLEPLQYTAPLHEYRHMVEDAVSAVFDDGYTATDEPIRFFYAPAVCYSEWHETALIFAVEHGGHRFFKAP